MVGHGEYLFTSAVIVIVLGLLCSAEVTEMLTVGVVGRLSFGKYTDATINCNNSMGLYVCVLCHMFVYSLVNT